MKYHYILELDRVTPECKAQYVWRLYMEPTAQELLDLLDSEELKEAKHERQ